MEFRIEKVTLNDILPYRDLFLHEINRQVRYDACHDRGWSDSYMFFADETPIGYGSVKGQEIADRDTVFEFYLLPTYRHFASRIFPTLLRVSDARYIETQSNYLLTTIMLYEFAVNIQAPVMLFEEGIATNLTAPEGVTFLPRAAFENAFNKNVEVDAGYLLEKDGEMVGYGDFLLHYNYPFADLYMEINEQHRRRGLGAYLIQELRNVCSKAGRVPAARCNMENKASKATLLKGGLSVAGVMLKGDVKQ